MLPIALLFLTSMPCAGFSPKLQSTRISDEAKSRDSCGVELKHAAVFSVEAQELIWGSTDHFTVHCTDGAQLSNLLKKQDV